MTTKELEALLGKKIPKEARAGLKLLMNESDDSVMADAQAILLTLGAVVVRLSCLAAKFAEEENEEQFDYVLREFEVMLFLIRFVRRHMSPDGKLKPWTDN